MKRFGLIMLQGLVIAMAIAVLVSVSHADTKQVTNNAVIKTARWSPTPAQDVMLLDSKLITYVYVLAPSGRVMMESSLVGDVIQKDDAIEWFDREGTFHRQYLNGVSVHLSDRPIKWTKRTKKIDTD